MKTTTIISLCIFAIALSSCGVVRKTTMAEALEATATTSATCDEGVEINGLIWATRNVGAPGTFVENPEDPGMFYQWNRRVGWSVTDPLISSKGDTSWDTTVPAGTSWEKENDPCPPGWRVPTDREFESLGSVHDRWITINGISGRLFGIPPDAGFAVPAEIQDSVFGIEPGQIFLPAVGGRYFRNGRIRYPASGFYWTTPHGTWRPENNTHAPQVSIRSRTTMGRGWFDRRNGSLIRCVKDVETTPSINVSSPAPDFFTYTYAETSQMENAPVELLQKLIGIWHVENDGVFEITEEWLDGIEAMGAVFKLSDGKIILADNYYGDGYAFGKFINDDTFVFFFEEDTPAKRVARSELGNKNFPTGVYSQTVKHRADGFVNHIEILDENNAEVFFGSAISVVPYYIIGRNLYTEKMHFEINDDGTLRVFFPESHEGFIFERRE